MLIVFVVLNMGDASDGPQNSVGAGFCMICAEHGCQSKLKLCRLNSEEAVHICPYPKVSFTAIYVYLRVTVKSYALNVG